MSRNFEINSKNDILYHRIYKKTHDEDSLLNYINLHFSDIDFKKTHGLLDDNLLTVSIASEYKKLSQYLLVFSNIEHVNKLGNTPLILSCDKNMSHIAFDIIKRKTYFGNLHINNKGNTALMCACKKNLSYIALLLTKKKLTSSYINNVNQEGYNAFMYACEYGFEIFAKNLLDSHLSLNGSFSVINLYGSNALMYAIKSKMNDIALEILKRDKYTIKEIDKLSNTPLIYACKYGLSTVANKIIEAMGYPSIEWRIDHINTYNNSALMYACLNKMDKIVDILIDKTKTSHLVNSSFECSPLITLIKNNKTELSQKILIKYQNMPNIVDPEGFTILHHACVNNNTTLALNILRKDFSNIRLIKDSYGLLPIRYAFHNKMKRVISYYLRDFENLSIEHNVGGNNLLFLAYNYDLYDILLTIFKKQPLLLHILDEFTKDSILNKIIINGSDNGETKDSERGLVPCKICYGNIKEYKYICTPCGHGFMCKDCSTEIGEDAKCPYCRMEGITMVKIYEF
jgi:ankyrin repeat protein